LAFLHQEVSFLLHIIRKIKVIFVHKNTLKLTYHATYFSVTYKTSVSSVDTVNFAQFESQLRKIIIEVLTQVNATYLWKEELG
jgi:hypothetical protein